MNKSMLAGVGIGVASALALSAVASGSLFSSEPQFAEVLASKPVTETIKTPRQECRNVTVTHRKPVQDEHKILGTVVGAALGGVVGHQFGGGSGKKVATALGILAGAAAGATAAGTEELVPYSQVAFRDDASGEVFRGALDGQWQVGMRVRFSVAPDGKIIIR